MTPVAAILVVLVVEGGVIALRQPIRRLSRVSSLRRSDYRDHPLITALHTGLAVFLVSRFVFFPPDPASGWSDLVSVAVYVAAKGALVGCSFRSALRSQEKRLEAVLSSPEFASAEFAIYMSAVFLREPDHVKMWLEPLSSLGLPFMVVLREAHHLKGLEGLSGFETIVVRSAEVDFLPETVRAVFFVNNSMHNTPVLKKYQHLTHIQLLHGDSDKPPSFNPYSRVYDRLFVAGQMAIDRYARNGVYIPAEKFRIVGRPQLRPFKWVKKDTVTVVYMTTWGGTHKDANFSSWADCEKIVASLLVVQGVDEVIFKPHPATYLSTDFARRRAAIEKAASATGKTFRWAPRTEDPFALYATADVLVTDISSTVIDYLYSGKPSVVTNPRGFSKEKLGLYPSVSASYICQPDASNVADLVALALGADPMAEKRAEVQAYAFGDLDREPGEAFREACYEFLGRP